MQQARKKSKPKLIVKAEDGTTYPTAVPLPFTPGFKRLVSGLRCLVICSPHAESSGRHESVRCKIKECYKHVILIGVGKYYRNDYLVSPVYLANPKRNGMVPDSFYHQLVLSSLSGERVMPKELQSYIRKESSMGKGDKKLRSRRDKKRRRTPAERKAKAKQISSKKSTKKEKKKHISIRSVLFAYFDQVGLKNIKYDRALKIAQKVKADTAFNASHFSWYRNQYRLKHDIK